MTASVVLKSLPESYEFSSGVQARIERCHVQGGDVRVDISSGSNVRMLDLTGDLDRLSVDVSSGAQFELDCGSRLRPRCYFVWRICGVGI